MITTYESWLIVSLTSMLATLLIAILTKILPQHSSQIYNNSRQENGILKSATATALKAGSTDRENETALKDFIEQTAVGITKVSLDGVWLEVNKKFCDMLGYGRHEIIGKTVKGLTHTDDYDKGARIRIELIESRTKSIAGEKRFIHKDGTIIWVRQTMSVGRDNNDNPQYVISVVEDISERKQAEIALQQSEELFRQLAANIPEVFWIGDIAQKNILYVSPAAERLFGRPSKEFYACSRTLIRAIYKDDRPRIRDARKNAASGNYDEIFRILRPDGTIRWVRDRAFPVRDAAGRLYRIAGIAEDITDRKKVEERLFQLAHYDMLTGLPNRFLFYDRLKQALAQANRNASIFGVMFIDIDRFKYINDTLGHEVGDKLLQRISERLVKAVRSNDTVGRLGGDEFAVVLSNLANSADAVTVAQKILKDFNEPFDIGGGTEIYVTGSIGITIYPTDSTDHDALLKNADLAMYRAKENGGNTYDLYVHEMSGRASGRLDMQCLLRGALERNEFEVYYQPRVAVESNKVIGVEALLRWNSRELGLVYPNQFIPVAEDTGLIVSIGEWVLRTACAQSRAWQDRGLAPLRMSVNLSPRQFREKNLVEVVTSVILETGLDAHFLELEITESLIMSHADHTIALLERLHRLGVQLSIDDFGTGYSSLAYLKRFPVQTIKIDKSFVRDLTTDSDDAAIVTAVIAMAKSLRLKVTAEGVENKEQLHFLATLNCDEYQGYYFSKPMPADYISSLLRRTEA
jgi:diguanylate cyclase (GGDEF)-like protein/PAS domain S-box-containing protein